MGTIWKVNGENKYFMRESNTRWGEYVNGQKQFDFEFLGQQGNSILLRKIGWNMYLKINSDTITIGGDPNNCNACLYYGSWVNNMSTSSSSSGCTTRTVVYRRG